MPTRILFVDDEPDIRSVVKLQLTAEGFEVETAASGERVIETLEQATFDVVLLDMHMPGKDGIQVLKEMRERKISTPVIMLTAERELPMAIKAMNLGIDDYLTKPFFEKHLVAAIRRALQKRGKQNQPATTETRKRS